VKFCPQCGASTVALKYCGECGTRLSDFKQIINPPEADKPRSEEPLVRDQPQTPEHSPTPGRSIDQQILNAIGLAALLIIGGVACVLFLSRTEGPVRVDSASTSAPADDGHITEDRFEAVAEVFRREGVRVERDPRARDTVRIYFPASIALNMTKQQAKVIASTTRGRLGDRAIVYVKTDAGDTIAKASPWGLE
jgi:hypothetical protein